ncbi:uncharacterized protein PGTG_13576 [Puccinia graminis f. sp. tritici CRL 75-36-700-3]|uniref:Uncharacterized protein n=1 Tax=Puccinia graminis f. sp. tritici (strain CRL 75-36-700-3 / race SCCL) TaxID=418459 RepID=E3KSW2_PUCGT|nr:uncharacterized protein PGTG_13576 [Puccinia graminis f. sp. tritici CRL 75-36-700-3]EFP87348.1 hypothetical protein PGTG_13576 [Puccinia graminis f. sp. tritici CRL 75-36-700-3]
MDSRPTPEWYEIRLPWPLSYFPSIFRFLSLAYIAPIILLSVIDVGGYLLFKLFYKPFGNYPMYAYFKQAPPREEADSEPTSPRKLGKKKSGRAAENLSASSSSSSEASSTLSSPVIQPTISLNSTSFSSPNKNTIPDRDDDDDDDNDRLRSVERKSSLRRRSSSSKKNKKSAANIDPDNHRHLIGFEGPMLDFKSPTASDYEE